jgi:colicin import membrane protein
MTDERSMIDRDPETSSESDDTSADDKSAGDLAADLRAQLGARQEVETLLAEASEARRTAAAEADDILAQAQRVADELTEGVRLDAERETAAARERAAGIVAQAKAEADEILGKVEAESASARAAADAEMQEYREQARVVAADEARAQFDGLRSETAQLFADLEQRFGTVQSAMSDAETAVRDTLERLDELRTTPGEELAIVLSSVEGEAALERADSVFAQVDDAELVDGPSDALERRGHDELAEVGSSDRNGDKSGSKETRPLGWLFRNQP